MHDHQYLLDKHTGKSVPAFSLCLVYNQCLFTSRKLGGGGGGSSLLRNQVIGRAWSVKRCSNILNLLHVLMDTVGKQLGFKELYCFCIEFRKQLGKSVG